MAEKLDFKKTLLLSSLIFGMFFGAGNLIFPIHLGQLAGQNWLMATIAFLMSATILPWLALIALSQTRSAGIYDIAKPVGHRFAIFFLIATHVSLGPMIATPRTATVAYSLSFANWLPNQVQGIGLFLFSAIFFALVFWLGSLEKNITKYIGKYLNPIFIILLLLIFLLAIVHPMGSLSHSANPAYQTKAFSLAFLEGYNTVDALAALVFGITIVRAIQIMGFKQSATISKITAKTGFIAIMGIAIVYVGLIVLGATSLSQFTFSDNGTIALTQIMMYYLGDFGSAFLAVMGTLAVLTTAIGLTASFAQDFHRIFPKISYRSWLIVTIGLSFLASNLGLDTIIIWAEPMLMFLYPIAIALIMLGVASPLFHQARIVYLPTMSLTFIPAIIDGIQHLPINITRIKPFLTWYSNTIPMAEVGLEWSMATIIGFVIGLILYKLQVRNKSILIKTM